MATLTIVHLINEGFLACKFDYEGPPNFISLHIVANLGFSVVTIIKS